MVEEKFYDVLAEKIMETRIKKGVNQETLANYLNLSRSSVTNIEKGRQKPSIFILMKICQFFNVSIDELIPNTEQDFFEISDSRIITQDFNRDFINSNESLHRFLELTK